MTHDDETTLLAATFDALNEGTLAQARRRLDKFIAPAPDTSHVKFNAEVVRLLQAHAGEQAAMWEAWWQGERADAIRALRHLAARKRLSAEDVDTYTYLVQQGVMWVPRFAQPERGRVRMDPVPRFNHPATLVAYVLLRLSNMHERIVVCPAPKVGEPGATCERLVLDKPHVGHPMKFCSTPCRHRFNSQKVRDNYRRPARHKRGEGR